MRWEEVSALLIPEQHCLPAATTGAGSGECGSWRMQLAALELDRRTFQLLVFAEEISPNSANENVSPAPVLKSGNKRQSAVSELGFSHGLLFAVADITVQAKSKLSP